LTSESQVVKKIDDSKDSDALIDMNSQKLNSKNRKEKSEIFEKEFINTNKNILKENKGKKDLKNKSKRLKTVWQDFLLSGQMGNDKEKENKGKNRNQRQNPEEKEELDLIN